jgi:recombination protein RecT
MATQLAERTASPIAVFRQTLTQPAFREQLKMALPSHIPEDRFIRVALTAAQQNPDLLNPQKVDRNSLFGALVKAAQDGLLPDGREGAIVPYKGKAQWQPMVAGIMTKVRRSGEIANWEVAAVFEKDQFERLLGDDQRIYHKPYEDGDPGAVIGAYSIVTFKDGTRSRDYLPRWRIEKARSQAMAKDSLMWTKFYDEGAIKTVVKHHSKRLPMATDIEAVFERDETMEHVNAEREVHPAAEPARPPLSRLDAIEHQIIGDEQPVDPPVETPEIEAQAEEIEAEIDQPSGEQPGFNLADEIERDAEKTPAEEAVEKVIAAMDAAKDAKELEKIIADAEKHKPAMADDLQMKLEVAYSRNRGRFAAVVAE